MKTSDTVTGTRRQILLAIYDYIMDSKGKSPSYRDIMKLAGIRSTSNMGYFIPALIKSGMLTRGAKGSPRTLQITAKGMGAIGKPVVCPHCRRPLVDAWSLPKQALKPAKHKTRMAVRAN